MPLPLSPVDVWGLPVDCDRLRALFKLKSMLLDKRFPHCEKIQIIDGEDPNRNASHRRSAGQQRPRPLEVVGPPVCAWMPVRTWMQEADDPAGAGIRASDIRTFVPIAMKTSQSEIPQNGLTAMLARHDMIGVKRQGIRGSRKATILAPVLRALTDPPDKVPVHEWAWSRGFLLRASRALDCMTARRFPMCR
jgi:hypothetical protein